jgi:hypothetical protein
VAGGPGAADDRIEEREWHRPDLEAGVLIPVNQVVLIYIWISDPMGAQFVGYFLACVRALRTGLHALGLRAWDGQEKSVCRVKIVDPIEREYNRCCVIRLRRAPQEFEST